MNTRDTFGFAMKATYVEIEKKPKDNIGESLIIKRPIFKDPITDGGTKKSAKGLLSVIRDKEGEYILCDNVDETTEANCNLLTTIYKDGVFFNEVNFQEIRQKIDDLFI